MTRKVYAVIKWVGQPLDFATPSFILSYMPALLRICSLSVFNGRAHLRILSLGNHMILQFTSAVFGRLLWYHTKEFILYTTGQIVVILNMQNDNHFYSVVIYRRKGYLYRA